MHGVSLDLAGNLDVLDFSPMDDEMGKLRTMDENRWMWLAYHDQEMVSMGMQET